MLNFSYEKLIMDVEDENIVGTFNPIIMQKHHSQLGASYDDDPYSFDYSSVIPTVNDSSVDFNQVK
jgi:hypothetical protein